MFIRMSSSMLGAVKHGAMILLNQGPDYKTSNTDEMAEALALAIVDNSSLVVIQKLYKNLEVFLNKKNGSQQEFHNLVQKWEQSAQKYEVK